MRGYGSVGVKTFYAGHEWPVVRGDLTIEGAKKLLSGMGGLRRCMTDQRDVKVGLETFSMMLDRRSDFGGLYVAASVVALAAEQMDQDVIVHKPNGWPAGGHPELSEHSLGIPISMVRFLYGHRVDPMEDRTGWRMIWEEFAENRNGLYVQPYGSFKDADRSKPDFWGRLTGTVPVKGTRRLVRTEH